MAPRVPDEYFRKRSSESDDVREEAPSHALPDAPPRHERVTESSREGIAPRLLGLILVVAMAAAFVLGRLLIFVAETPAEQATPSTPAPSVDASPDAFVPYDGTVRVVAASRATGGCREGGTRDNPEALLDNDSEGIWRCHGDGVGESATFSFESPMPLVGVRLINGNTVWSGRYAEERRLLSVRWQFSDGSFFVQGLAANNRGLQEARFPQVTTGSVTMTITASTEPGEKADMVDAVSVSSLEFLAPS